MRYLELTEKEIEALASMIDIAVRAQGLAIAKNAAFLLDKLQAAQDVEDTDPE